MLYAELTGWAFSQSVLWPFFIGILNRQLVAAIKKTLHNIYCYVMRGIHLKAFMRINIYMYLCVRRSMCTRSSVAVWSALHQWKSQRDQHKVLFTSNFSLNLMAFLHVHTRSERTSRHIHAHTRFIRQPYMCMCVDMLQRSKKKKRTITAPKRCWHVNSPACACALGRMSDIRT